MPTPIVGRDYPSSLGEFLAWFGTDADCLDYLEWLRWPNGFVCPSCDHQGGWRMSDGRFRCAGCGHRTSVTAGTIFDRTRTPLTVWFMACWMFATQKDGVSAQSLQRSLEIGSYQTAWAMLHRLRSVLIRPGRRTPVGHRGGRRNVHRRRGAGAAWRASEGQEVPCSRCRGTPRAKGLRPLPDDDHSRRIRLVAAHDDLRSRRVGLAGDHRRLAGIPQDRQARLRPRPAQPARRTSTWRRPSRTAPRGAPRLCTREAVAAWNSPRIGRCRSPAELPRRICVPLQPAHIT